MRYIVTLIAIALPLLSHAAKPVPKVAKPITKQIGPMTVNEEEFEQAKKFADVDMGEMMGAALDSVFRPGKITWTLQPTYDRTPSMTTLGREDLAVLADCCRAVGQEAFGKIRVEISVAVPNQQGSHATIEKIAVQLKGKPLKFDADLDHTQLSNGLISIDLEKLAIPSIAESIPKLKGTVSLTVKMPIDVKAVVFQMQDVGQTKEGITFKGFRGKQAVFEGSHATLEGARVSAVDSTNAKLGEGGSSGYSPDGMATMKALLKKSWAELPAKTEIKETTFVKSAGFRGTPVRYTVEIPTKFAEKKMTIPIVFKDKFAQSRMFESAFQRRTCKLDQRLLNANTKVGATRSEAMMGFGRPTLFVQFPSCDNSIFAVGEFSNLKFFGEKNQPIAKESVEIQKGLITKDDFSDELRFGVKSETPSRDASFPALKAVSAHVRYDVPNIEVVRLTKKSPSAQGLKAVFKGTDIAVSGHLFDARYKKVGNHLSPSAPQILAFDRFGRGLSSFSSGSGSDGETRGYSIAPDAIEVIVLKPGFVFEKDVRVEFPAPPSPKDKEEAE